VTPARLLAVPAVAAAAATAPVITSIGPLRQLFFPRLHGRGLPGRIALTFDDGPDPSSTPRFLDLLGAHEVTATFFVLGSQALVDEELLARIHREGHEVAVHGWTHRNHLRLSPSRVIAEIGRTADLITSVCGSPPRLARPPYGALSWADLAAGRRHGVPPVLWSAWGRDWEARATPARVLARLAPGFHGGATLLLHDSDCTSAPGAWQSALGALPDVIAGCRSRGLRFVSMSEHLALPLA